jgi:hypothetical protein
MPYTQTNTKIEAFNKRFGTNVSLKKIQSEARRLGSYDTALRNIFCDEYRKVLLKDLMFPISENSISYRMLNEFNDNIVNALLTETPNASAVGLSADMGHKTLGEKFGMVQAILKEHEPDTVAPEGTPKTSVDVFTKNYMNGNVKIRDMLNFVNTYNPQDKNSKVTSVTLVSCVAALRRANESRSFLWKIFHPIKNYSEQKYARIMDTAVRGVLNEDTYNRATDVSNRQITNLRHLVGFNRSDIYVHPVYNENNEIIKVHNMENYQIYMDTSVGDPNRKNYVERDRVPMNHLKEELYAPGEPAQYKQIPVSVLDNSNIV